MTPHGAFGASERLRHYLSSASRPERGRLSSPQLHKHLRGRRLQVASLSQRGEMVKVFKLLRIARVRGDMPVFAGDMFPYHFRRTRESTHYRGVCTVRTCGAIRRSSPGTSCKKHNRSREHYAELGAKGHFHGRAFQGVEDRLLYPLRGEEFQSPSGACNAKGRRVSTGEAQQYSLPLIGIKAQIEATGERIGQVGMGKTDLLIALVTIVDWPNGMSVAPNRVFKTQMGARENVSAEFHPLSFRPGAQVVIRRFQVPDGNGYR